MIDDFETVMMKMEEIHNQWPSLRFCQVIGNVVRGDAYYITDDVLITALDNYLEKN